MPLILQGATSGQATLQATDAQTVTITMPATSGTLVTTGGAQTIEFADGSASAPSITNSGDTNTGMFFPAADTIAFTEGGTEAMRLNSAGNMGIGETSIASDTRLHLKQTADNCILKVQSSFGSILNLINGGGSEVSTINATGNNVLTMQTGSTERMRITSAGAVGIGTSSPTNTLQVTSSASDPYILIGGTVARDCGIKLNATNEFTALRADGANRLFVGSGNEMRFLISGSTEAMRIASNGRVDINNGGAIDVSRFSIQMSSGDNGMTIRSYDSSTSVMMHQFYTLAGSRIGFIQTVGGTSTTYSTSSDYRLKENIVPMTGALAKVSQLKPVTYKWKSNGLNGQGFIAHELAEVVPDCVTGEKDGMRTEEYEVSPAIEATYDEEGNELTPAVEAVMGEREVPDYQGIDTSFLVATLTAAIQELKATVDAQAARIAALEGAK